MCLLVGLSGCQFVAVRAGALMPEATTRWQNAACPGLSHAQSLVVMKRLHAARTLAVPKSDCRPTGAGQECPGGHLTSHSQET